MPYVEMVMGLAEYRRGNYEAAVDRCLTCLAAGQSPQAWHRTTVVYLIMAMARAQLGEFDQARQDLETGREILSIQTRQLQSDQLYDFWNWIVCNTLLAEAEGVVGRR